jgi:hypothetical protein
MSVQSTSSTWFTPVAMAISQRGGCATDQLDQALWTWATSPPLRSLAAASNWEWPAAETTLGLLRELADLSADWDFRKNRERHFIEPIPAEVNGRQIPDAQVINAARGLGLVDPAGVAAARFSYVLVLSGQAAACVSRVRYAAELIRRGVQPDAVVLLGAHRQLLGTEPEQVMEAGLGHLTDEAEVALAAVTQAFQLGPPLSSEETQPAPHPGQPAVFHAASAHYRWPAAEVVIAPSDQPEVRRAKTGDQLQYWANLAGLRPRHEVLIVTSQINVPYQHLVAARVLGLGHGCAVYCCGTEAADSLPSARSLGGRDYLQELRATLRAAVRLLRQAHQGSAEGVPD